MTAGCNFKVGIGQDSHRFAWTTEDRANDSGGDCIAGQAADGSARRLVLGGEELFGAPPLVGNSDADVVLHALTNAISGVTGVNILGAASDSMCLEEGITDSAEYVREAMKHLGDLRLAHISFSIECKIPIISPSIPRMREKIAEITGLPVSSVCVTATSGEGLTPFGQGLGIQVFCIVTACG